MTKRKNDLEATDACMLIHTALRKHCDSDITSALYNVIHIMPEIKPRSMDPWIIFGGLVADQVNRMPEKNPTSEMVAERLRSIAGVLRGDVRPFYDAFWAREEERRKQDKPRVENATTAFYTYQSLFKCLDDKDWIGMAAYLVENDG